MTSMAAASRRNAPARRLDSLLGVPSAAAIAALARPYGLHEAFICGPDPYLALVREALGRLGVPPRRVHTERFLSLAEIGVRLLWVPTISSTSRDQAIFVDRATDASLSSYPVLAENDRLW